MKEKIMLFVIGILVGAVIATGAFYIYTTTNSNDCNNQTTQMNGGIPPELPSGQNGQPPARPDGENEQPPEMPSNSNIQDSNQNNN